MQSPVDHSIAVDHHPACRVPGLQNMKILFLHITDLMPALFDHVLQVGAFIFSAVVFETSNIKILVSVHLDRSVSLRALDV